MAEVLLRERLAEVAGDGPVPEVSSAGVDVASPGGPASEGAVEATAGRGTDLSGHRTRPLDADLLAGATLVVAMTRRHEAAVGALEPGPQSGEWLDDSSHRPTRQRSVADQRRGDLLTGQDTREETDRGAGVACVEWALWGP